MAINQNGQEKNKTDKSVLIWPGKVGIVRHTIPEKRHTENVDEGLLMRVPSVFHHRTTTLSGSVICSKANNYYHFFTSLPAQFL